MAVRKGDRRRDRLQPPAVGPDGEGREVVLGVRAIRIDERLEEDRLGVDEFGATGQKVWCRLGRDPWSCAGGEVRHLPALAGREIEHEDLHGLHASGSRSEVREGYLPSVRAEEYRRGEDPVSPEVPQADEEILPEAEAPVTARRAEATESEAAGADEEEPLLFRGKP